ncbi:MAG: substrate-binding domain-containing protein [Anaerolineales bacterium]|nr:substrate-binding domain-containing protein [Anaerolineales bacterium]
MSRVTNHKSRQSNVLIVTLIGLLILVISSSCLCWVIAQGIKSTSSLFDGGGDEQTAVLLDDVLRVAYSPEKEGLFTALVDGYNQTDPNFPIYAMRMDPDAMLQGALNNEFEAMSPDSSVWLHQLDEAYADQLDDSDAFLVSQTRYYAISPVVIAMWRDAAQELGWPGKSIGWNDLVNHAIANPDFNWSHPSTASASGLLATLAEVYAAAGVTRGLTESDLEKPETVSRLQAMEKTVSYYGEGEWAIAQQVNERGRDYLDAFVCQEQLVVWLNRQGRDIVAIYPVEGSLWEDHPLALLEVSSLTNEKRLAFENFASYLETTEAQTLVLSSGYRPADLNLDLKGSNSPLSSENGVDPDEPRTTLQIPGAQVIDQVQNVWWLIKRKTNVYLVVDTSGSMDGQKLTNVQQALTTFVNQIEGADERVGLIEFWSEVDIVAPLERLGDNRSDLLYSIQALEAGGNTAMLDGVNRAYKELLRLNDTERINAIVVMTDGLENASQTQIWDLTSKLELGKQSDIPVVVFAIAYGSDADYVMLEQLAESSGGQVREGTVETIRELYKILSTYF